jgi:hypothetical protein
MLPSSTFRTRFHPTSALVVLALLVLPAFALGQSSTRVPFGPSAGVGLSGTTSLPTLSDNSNLSITVGGVQLRIADSISYLSDSPWNRSYQIRLTTLAPNKTVALVVSTAEMTDWAFPAQMPGGPDALPPFAEWTWTVATGSGVNDSSNWTVARWTDALQRTTAWVSATYTVVGRCHPSLTFAVGLPSTSSDRTTGMGVVLNPEVPAQGPLFPASDPTYGTLLKGIGDTLVRFGEVDAGTQAHWSTSLNAPVFNFTALNAAFNLTASEHAGVLYTFSVGSWGDGNLLPAGMPLNKSLLVADSRVSGYFPTGAAYRTYIATLVAHFAQLNDTPAYWAIGNEVPLTNASVVSAFITLFNIAQKVIHSYYPAARVGTDVMMNRTYLPTFAKWSKNVGFLSFHFYPAIGICLKNGQYCPPAGPGQGSYDSAMWKPYARMLDQNPFYPPSIAQMMWRNLTGNWIPVLDSESNLNGVGGAAANSSMGTDPRQQTLFGAAWLVSTLIDASNLNVTTLTYYTLSGLPPSPPPSTSSGPYGGWGFGMTAEGSNNQHILYAPYWAAHLWGVNLPAGGRGYEVSSPEPTVARAYAATTPYGLAVVLVSLSAMQVKIHVEVTAPGLGATRAATLDQTSYVERYRASTHQEILLKSGLTHLNESGKGANVTLSLRGYGVSVVHFAYGTVKTALGRATSPVRGVQDSARTRFSLVCTAGAATGGAPEVLGGLALTGSPPPVMVRAARDESMAA